VYEYEGIFKNLILSASYTSKAKGALDRGNMTMMLRKNGSVLKGYCSFYDDKKHDVVTKVYTWIREKK
jgi:hypothetical protein